VPSVESRFGGFDNSDGIYHSIYDDFFYYTKFLDTDFAYGRALRRSAARWSFRLADADLLPFEYTDLADTVQTYVKELQALLKTQQDDVRERNRQIDEGVFAATERSEAAPAGAKEGAGGAGAQFRSARELG
jgi:N-acetylated-alpha-linked acidic dipeptidase